MKYTINLYSAEFMPRRVWFSATQIALSWGFGVLLVLLIGGGYHWKQKRLEHELEWLHATLELKRAENQRLDIMLTLHRVDPNLERQLTDKMNERTAKQALMQRLDTLVLEKEQSYALVMADLARVNQATISLQRFEINNKRINLFGFASNSQAVPNWINRFKQTSTLAGKEFAELTLDRDNEGRLTFWLSGSGQDKS